MKVLVSPVNPQGRKAPGSTAHRGEKKCVGRGFQTLLEQQVDHSNIYSYAGVAAVPFTFQLSDQRVKICRFKQLVSFTEYVGLHLGEEVRYPEKACRTAACLTLAS